ncbi:hypothetical protein ACWEWL_10520 [Streptomyces rochei]
MTTNQLMAAMACLLTAQGAQLEQVSQPCSEGGWQLARQARAAERFDPFPE